MKLLKIGGGLVLGLVLAELMFSWRDSGAFPHLNIYVADAELGARLEKNATTKLGVGSNPVATIHTNDRGYRGGAWPEKKPDDILVVGDSQVFGLGVEDGETFSAELQKLTGRTVINGGVPTYGPREYTAVIRELQKERPARDVVFVMNIANDLFELNRSNTARHVIWDGWAVRAETAPEDRTSWIPWLKQRSHLVFALRSLAAKADDAGFASEGTWQDLVRDAASQPAAPPPQAAPQQRLSDRTDVSNQLRTLGGKIEYEFSQRALRQEAFGNAATQIAHYKGSVNDIVLNQNAEAARPIDNTAWQLLRAAIPLEDNEPVLRAAAEKAKDTKFLALLDERRALREKIRALNGPADVERTPADAVFGEAIAAAAPARVTFLILPLDVQVSGKEWAKYKKPEQDMAPTLALNRMLVRAAEARGARAFDAQQALAAAEPGAFLDGDLHMTPKGHRALAAALAADLARVDPVPPSEGPKLAPGRSWPPVYDEWARAKEIVVKGSSAALCETKLVREWFRIRCISKFPKQQSAFEDDPDDPTQDPVMTPLRVALERGGHGDAYAEANGYAVELVLPILPGDDALAKIYWKDHDRTLKMAWPPGASAPQFALGEPNKSETTAASVVPLAIATEIRGGQPLDQTCKVGERRPSAECALDNPTRPPRCADGFFPFGALRRCQKDCSNSGMCKTGRCEPWLMGSACVVP